MFLGSLDFGYLFKTETEVSRSFKCGVMNNSRAFINKAKNAMFSPCLRLKISTFEPNSLRCYERFKKDKKRPYFRIF